jgi:hypothetical protein
MHSDFFISSRPHDSGFERGLLTVGPSTPDRDLQWVINNNPVKSSAGNARISIGMQCNTASGLFYEVVVNIVVAIPGKLINIRRKETLANPDSHISQAKREILIKSYKIKLFT